MRKRSVYLLSGGLVVAGIALLGLAFYRPISITVDGQKEIVQMPALTSGQVLRWAGIEVEAGDRVVPPAGEWLGWNDAIQVEHLRTVTFWKPSAGQPSVLYSAERKPANLALKAGIKL